MNRYKKLLGNSAIFAIGSLGSKLISFILVPLYTYVLTKEQFGTVDLITTSVNLVLPIITLSAFDAVFRFVLDKNENENKVLVNGLLISFQGALIGLLIIPVLTFMHVPMPIYIYGMLVSGAFLSLFLNFTRAVNKVKTFAIAGILGTIVIAASNILFLVILHKGVQGYLLSIIISNTIVILYLMGMVRILHRIRYKYIDKRLAMSMIVYSIPLIPNAFSWWINSSADRYFILAFVGASANGIYAVASKIPSLLNLINQIFFQSWQMSAVEEYSSGDASKFYSKTFNYFMDFQFIGSAGLLLVLKPLMAVIVSPTYYVAWKYIPFLLLAVVYSSLSGFLGTTYTAAKRTSGIFLTTMIGAVSNLIFGFILVRLFGLQGASLAGTLSFAIVLIVRLYDTRRFMPIHVNKQRMLLNHIIVLSMIIILFLDMNIIYSECLELLLFAIILIYNRKIFFKLLVR